MKDKKVHKIPDLTDEDTARRHIDLYFNHKFVPEASRTFKSGDKVEIGCLKNCQVVKSYLGGKFVLIKSDSGLNIFEWTSVFYPTTSKDSVFDVEDIRISSSQRQLADLLSKVYHFGVDVNPIYQRPYIWESQDKIKLIETIFEHGNIGLFVFNHKHFEENGSCYEIIDGKQRLNAITDFYEDKFKVKGFYFSELTPNDKSSFKNSMILESETHELDLKTQLKLFLKINRTGRQVEESHIKKVKELLKNINCS